MPIGGLSPSVRMSYIERKADLIVRRQREPHLSVRPAGVPGMCWYFTSHGRGKMRVSHRPITGAALAIALSAASLPGCGKPPAPLAPPDAPTVTARNPEVRPYSPTKEFSGRLVTRDPVTVIPQVSGMLRPRLFDEGQEVQGPYTLFGYAVAPGMRMFEIDKTQFVADLQKAKADIAKADADAKNWTAQIRLREAEFAQADDAFKRAVGSKNDLDKAAANVDVARAQLDVAKATKDSAVAAEAKAAENLRYCTITAPVSGRTRRALVPNNSVVDAYKTELVEISPLDELYAVFEVDELTSLWYREQIYEKKTIKDPRNAATPLRCWITLRDGRTYPPRDKPGQPVSFIDPELVRSTGTRLIRATFPNADRRLSPGDSVLVRVDAGEGGQVLTVPETAVFAQQRKRYVYVVASSPEGDKAVLREVEPGASFDGVVIIENGLATSDRVIVDNLLRVRPGSKVQVQK